MQRCIAAFFLCAAASSAGMAQATKPGREPLATVPVSGPLSDVGDSVANRPALTPGRYMLVLTPARVGGKPAPRAAEPIASSVAVSQRGNEMSVVNTEGLALSGRARGARFTVVGQNGDGKLTLIGAAAKGGADGDFTLTFADGSRVEGGFILASPNSAGIQASHKLQDYGDARTKGTNAACDWWCGVREWLKE